MNAQHDLHLAGLVLAAGRSQRMGTLKQTLPWLANHRPSEIRSPATVVSCAYDAIAPFCDRMFVVVGRDAPVVLAALEGGGGGGRGVGGGGARHFTRVDADSDAEMLASVRLGLEAVIAHESSLGEARPFDGVLLQPGDHPGAARSTIEAMQRAFREACGAKVVIPEYRDNGGHPALIPRTMCDTIIAHHGEGGLRQLWIDHPDLCVRVAVEDPLCVLDLNTPAAYRQAIENSQPMRRGSVGPAGADL